MPGSRFSLTKLRLVPVLALLLLVSVLLAGCGATRNTMTTSGTIEGTEYDVTAQVAGTLTSLGVHRGDRVSAGQTLGRIDDGTLRLQLDQADAGLSAAEANLAGAVAGTRSQTVAAAAQVVQRALAAQDAARTRMDLQQWQTASEKDLYQAGAVSHQVYRAREAAYQSARDHWAEARAAYNSALDRLKLDRAGNTRATIDALAAQVAQSQDLVGQTRLALAKATLVSPIAGRVEEKNFSAGEFVPAGAPVVTLIDDTHLWLYAYVPEKDMDLVHQGQKVRVTVDAYPGRAFTGQVSYISSQAEFTPKLVQTTQDRTILVFQVKIILNRQPGLLPGLPANVTFD
ncbi:MAG: HlyD family efflux transporter periplasmic adaptor subunit [Peptococcaceae bacterium]|jgi:HlyD family secretion protein|nr:HlyD family efflux transporter periplasmic adaptor subunit [Peptococcaceae bacterium]